jgi:bifunctional ADP-heptose synthase (sugar kinase/adenylyltransferase)
MTLYRRADRLHAPAQAREVYDVSGAGDTVIATLGVAMASGMPLNEAVLMANRAAGIVVAKFGTAVVEPHELLAAEQIQIKKS